MVSYVSDLHLNVILGWVLILIVVDNGLVQFKKLAESANVKS